MTAKERIDELRMKKGWSLNRLAEELGLTNTSVYAWYKKEGFNPSAQSIEKACEVFAILFLALAAVLSEKSLTTAFHSVPPARSLRTNKTPS